MQFRIEEKNKQNKQSKIEQISSFVNCEIMWIFLFGLLGLLSYFWCVFIALAMFEVNIFSFNFKFAKKKFVVNLL